ncbi:beta-ketoacyl-ACP synthase II, partial [Campylobacter jejuni]|nr:beta-ketoacyl-ACP synthase II [Campylobacter jejuni]
HAIGEAYKSIALGNAKKMLVIGAEAAICPVGIGGFASMKALSTRNEDPQHASRPFDKERDGFVMGEGAGALVFEEYEEAKKRGATIYAELIGFGESADAHHITSPTLDGPLRAMKKALNMAGNPKVDYINAHGTSTPVNDKNETAVIKELFGNNIPLVSSTKGQTGHCLGAAGAIEAVISVMALRDGVVPPTINQLVKDEECDLDYVPNISRKSDLKVVMSNSFGFGGTNGCV